MSERRNSRKVATAYLVEIAAFAHCLSHSAAVARDVAAERRRASGPRDRQTGNGNDVTAGQKNRK